MNILYLSHLPPCPPNFGAAKRIFHQIKEIAKRHRVTVLSFGNIDNEKQFVESIGPMVHRHVFVDNTRKSWLRKARRVGYLLAGKYSGRTMRTSAFQNSLDRLLAEETYDIIFCSTSLLGYYRLPHVIPTVGDTHNVEYDNTYRAFRESKNLIRKAYYFIEYRRCKRDEIRNLQKFDAVLATSERDLSLFQQDVKTDIMEVIPNGVDLNAFTPQKDGEEPYSIVFTGLMNYYPNDHAMTFFLDKIFPLIVARVPNAKIYIVGANPSRKLRERASDRVIVTGYVEDVRPYISRSQVSVIPILIGGGTRLKALEAMAMKKPIVSTSIGCEGISLKDGESVLFADSPTEFADAVIRLITDEALRHRIAEHAYRNVVKIYSWEAIGERLEHVNQALYSSRVSPVRAYPSNQ